MINLAWNVLLKTIKSSYLWYKLMRELKFTLRLQLMKLLTLKLSSSISVSNVCMHVANANV